MPTLVTGIAFLLAACSCQEALAQMRAGVPTPERQKEVARLLESAYQLTALEGNAKKQAALQQLMEASRDEQMSDDERYVVLKTAISLATEVGDIGSWREAVAALVETFEVEAEKERARFLSELLRSGKTAPQMKSAIEEALKLSKTAAEQHRFADAASLLDLADTALKRATNAESLRKAIQATRETVTVREKEWNAFQTASAKLDADADDPAANFTVGRWHLLDEVDWEMALPFLAKAGDARWKSASLLEQTSPTDAAAQTAIGDAWYAIAEKESGPLKTVLLLRAAHWYRVAQPNLKSALMKQLVARRLAEIAPLHVLGAGKPAGTPNVLPDSVATASPEWIDLLEWCEGVDWKERGLNWNANLEAPPTRQGMTLKSGACSRFPIPAVIDGNYELEIEFTRTEGHDSVDIFFPVHDHSMQLEFSKDGGRMDLVAWIDGERSDRAPTTRKPAYLRHNNQRHRLRIVSQSRGDNARFSVDIDDRKDYITWEGRHSSLHNCEGGDWSISMMRHFWVGAMHCRLVFHKMRVRMTSGTIRRDVITNADRAADLKNGFIRLVGEKPSNVSVGWWTFLVNQLPIDRMGAGHMERRWPLVTRDCTLCPDYYGAHAPSQLRCPIPAGAKSFSVVGYNDASRMAEYNVLIDGVKMYASGVTDIAVAKIDIPPKASLLELDADPAGDNWYDQTYWCYPRFHMQKADKIDDRAISAKTATPGFSVQSSTVGFASLTHNQPIIPLGTGPLHFMDAKPCDEFLWAHAPSKAQYRVPPGMTRFTAIGYNRISQHVKFEIWTEERRIYQSPQAGIVPIDIKLPAGTKTIELRVDSLGDTMMDLSAWCYPRLYRK